MLEENGVEGITYNQRKRYLFFMPRPSSSSKCYPEPRHFPSLCSLGAFTEHTQLQHLINFLSLPHKC